MPTKLRNLKITRVDLVDKGANPHAHVLLFKREQPCKYTDAQISAMVDQMVAEARERANITKRRGDSMPDFNNYSERSAAVRRLEEKAARGEPVRAAVADLTRQYADVAMRLDPKLSRLDAEIKVVEEFPRLQYLDMVAAARGEPLPIDEPIEVAVDPELAKAEAAWDARVESIRKAAGVSRQAAEEVVWKRCAAGQDDVVQRLNTAQDRAHRRT